MNVGHLVFRTDSLTYTVAKALSCGGHNVFIRVVDPAQDHRDAEGIQKCLRDTARVTIIAGGDAGLPAIDRLIVQVFPRPAESIRSVDSLAAGAHRISVITAGDRSRPWRDAMKLQWHEARRLARYAHKIDRILYKDGFYPRDLLGLFKPRSNLGFDVHSQFLHDEELCRAVHVRDWAPDMQRPILANFLGCRDPAVRERVLAAVRPYFRTANGSSPSTPTGKVMYWHEYPDTAPIGIEPQEFLKVLTRSDFTLCPRGYSLVTHRPMEALLRGSIPVLSTDELDLYGIRLVDGENCVGVPVGRWPETLRRLACIEQREIIRMRGIIHAMFDEQLRYEAVAKAMRLRLGADV
jgi:hypothetical protein